MSELALVGLMRKKVTFTSSEVLHCGWNVIGPQFGLLHQIHKVGNDSGEVRYHFSLMTWQEFLGTRSLARDEDFIKKLKMRVTSIAIGEHTHILTLLGRTGEHWCAS